MMIYKVLIRIPIITILSMTMLVSAHANEKGYFAFELGQASIDNAIALQEGIKETSNYIRLGYEKHYGTWSFGGGISGFLYSDNEGFKQRVVNLAGSRKTASSSASSTNVFVEGGYSYTVTEMMTVDLLAGYEYIASSSRSIANCSDCATDNINVNAGIYVSPRFTYEWSNGFKLGLFYRQFLSADVTSTIGLNFAWRV